MREIEFRGFAVEKMVDNQWLHGFGVAPIDYVDGTVEYHLHTLNGTYEIVPESIGQYIGVKDKNGKKIFEEDILQVTSYEGLKDIVNVCFDDGCFCHIGHLGDLRTYPLRDFLFNGSTLEVIGNTYENFDLLYENAEFLEGEHERD